MTTGNFAQISAELFAREFPKIAISAPLAQGMALANGCSVAAFGASYGPGVYSVEGGVYVYR